MPSRQKDQADFDLEQFVDLFDTAMSSDNPAVQRALKNLLMIATIVNAEDADAGMRQGPVRRVIEDQKNIVRRLQDLENQNTMHKQYGPIPPIGGGTPFGPVPLGPYVGSPIQWPNTGNPPPNQIWCATDASSTAFDDQYVISKDALTAATIGAIQDMDKKYNALLDKLETK
jgi:hypothetical protein